MSFNRTELKPILGVVPSIAPPKFKVGDIVMVPDITIRNVFFLGYIGEVMQVFNAELIHTYYHVRLIVHLNGASPIISLYHEEEEKLQLMPPDQMATILAQTQ